MKFKVTVTTTDGNGIKYIGMTRYALKHGWVFLEYEDGSTEFLNSRFVSRVQIEEDETA